VTPERRPVTTIYLYELAWILPSIAIPVGMLVALAVTAFGAGIHLPGVAGRQPPDSGTDAALQRTGGGPGRARPL
jgi:cytochrome c oxidase subunit 2